MVATSDLSKSFYSILVCCIFLPLRLLQFWKRFVKQVSAFPPSEWISHVSPDFASACPCFHPLRILCLPEAVARKTIEVKQPANRHKKTHRLLKRIEYHGTVKQETGLPGPKTPILCCDQNYSDLSGQRLLPFGGNQTAIHHEEKREKGYNSRIEFQLKGPQSETFSTLLLYFESFASCANVTGPEKELQQYRLAYLRTKATMLISCSWWYGGGRAMYTKWKSQTNPKMNCRIEEVEITNLAHTFTRQKSQRLLDFLVNAWEADCR